LTVTDAHVWLGRLQPDSFLGGEASLDRPAIEEPLADLAAGLGTTLDEAAEGIIDVADSAMEGALRLISVERGHDPADFALVPFGGAAGLHAVELAERLGIGRVLVPPDPGVLSAWGMLVSPVRKDVSRTVLLGPGDQERIAAVFDTLESEARAAMETEGVESAGVEIRRLADVRYTGQSYELRIPARDWQRTFHDVHEARYGFARPRADVELVTARVEALGPPSADRPRRRRERETQARSTHRVTVHQDGRGMEVDSLDRAGVPPGATVDGPAIVHEYSATFWLPPGWRAAVLESGSLDVRPT
jgi:N-methylhydantoinase A